MATDPNGLVKKKGRGALFSFVLPWVLLGGLGYAWVRWMEPKAPVCPPALLEVPGARLMYRYECGRCHTVALPGMDGKMGPPLKGLRDRAYIEESLRFPGRRVVHGYINGMPSFNQLPAAEIKELVDYVTRL